MCLFLCTCFNKLFSSSKWGQPQDHTWTNVLNLNTKLHTIILWCVAVSEVRLLLNNFTIDYTYTDNWNYINLISEHIEIWTAHIVDLVKLHLPGSKDYSWVKVAWHLKDHYRFWYQKVHYSSFDNWQESHSISSSVARTVSSILWHPWQTAVEEDWSPLSYHPAPSPEAWKTVWNASTLILWQDIHFLYSQCI